MGKARRTVLFALAGLLAPTVAHAAKTTDEYRYFRALSIDLKGRIPTRSEILAFEAPSFDEDAFVEQHLSGAAYSERLQRIYMDALRLEVPDAFLFRPEPTMLRRYSILVREVDGATKPVWVYWRSAQRRDTPTFDRRFCFGEADTGQVFTRGRAPEPLEPKTAVPRATFNGRVQKVRPWWLYRDYRVAAPREHYASWQGSERRYLLALPTDKVGPATAANDPRLLVDADGTATTEVYVCKEEASRAESAVVTVNGAPVTVACSSETGARLASTCGCGTGLERCTPGAGHSLDPAGAVLPSVAPLGPAEPFEVSRAPQSDWWKSAWAEEARRYFDVIFTEDRDFREVLTGRFGEINGPLAQFYRGVAGSDCCTEQSAVAPGTSLATPTFLVEPERVPADLLPHEMDRWVRVADRGPRAAGILTMPVFLAKFASRRGRANAVYNAFLCKDFIADKVALVPSDEPNLMIRPGCATCHAKLEPLSAFFARTRESAVSWLAAPVDNPACALAPGGVMSPACAKFYDPAFSTAQSGQLRGAYGSPTNVAKGPQGLAAEVVAAPEFAACVARTVSEGLVGRRLAAAEEAALGASVAQGGFRLKALVRAIVKSRAYKNANATGGAQ
ncbi:MAG: hypothetical protein IPG50_14480 [Myxococcales bacterium]|nr:hypothetical protein [Myxococcales bacterium]